MGRWPHAVLQFEDFNLAHAQPLLERYRQHHLIFNDDIQARTHPALNPEPRFTHSNLASRVSSRTVNEFSAPDVAYFVNL